MDYIFDAKEAKDLCIAWIRKYFDENGGASTKAVIGISGGKDSSVVAALCVEALGKERVFGVSMPNNYQHDVQFAWDLIRFLGIESTTVNIGETTNTLYEALLEHSDFSLNKMVYTNTPARIRMATLYAIAVCMNGRVANTCNLSENDVGWATIHGDMAGTFSPLANFTTEEVIAIGATLGLPEGLLYKIPEDGMCGTSDEEAFGFTYPQLNAYIRLGTSSDAKVDQMIKTLHTNSRWKYRPMAEFHYCNKYCPSF